MIAVHTVQEASCVSCLQSAPVHCACAVENSIHHLPDLHGCQICTPVKYSCKEIFWWSGCALCAMRPGSLRSMMDWTTAWETNLNGHSELIQVTTVQCFVCNQQLCGICAFHGAKNMKQAATMRRRTLHRNYIT